MGRASRAKQEARNAVNLMRDSTEQRKTRGPGAAQQRIARMAEAFHDPATQAHVAQYHDEECQRIKMGDALPQCRRLADDGWQLAEQNLDGLGTWDNHRRGLRMIHSVCRELDGQVWAHVSLSRQPGTTMPSWGEVRSAGQLLYPEDFGVIVVAPLATHVNIAEVAHVWYCLTRPAVPDFTHGMGSI